MTTRDVIMFFWGSGATILIYGVIVEILRRRTIRQYKSRFGQGGER